MENGEESETHEEEAEEGKEEVEMWLGGPAEDEEAGGEEQGAEHHGGKTGFGNGFVGVELEFEDVEFVVAGVECVSIFERAGGRENEQYVGAASDYCAEEDG